MSSITWLTPDRPLRSDSLVPHSGFNSPQFACSGVVSSFLKSGTVEIQVDIYSRPGCSLCDKAKAVIEKVKKDHPLTISEIDISKDPELLKKYGDNIPVVFINGRRAFVYKVHEVTLKKKLEVLLREKPRKMSIMNK